MGNFSKQGFWRSLGHAWQGLVYTWKTQGHMRFHVFAAIVVLGFAWRWQVSAFEWLILIVAIGCVIGAEVMNTAIESVVDLIQPDFDPLAGRAKDVAAGAVLVAVIQAVAIGLIVFLPRLVEMF